jgi:hypothetical protein
MLFPQKRNFFSLLSLITLTDLWQIARFSFAFIGYSHTHGLLLSVLAERNLNTLYPGVSVLGMNAGNPTQIRNALQNTEILK